MAILISIVAYFLMLMAFSLATSKKATNDAFFRGEKRSPWYLVAFGMIGASISGVTFISVPGMVMGQQMTYLQTCMGFILGYAAVAFILLPLYYRLNLTTIYSYLGKRLGQRSYKTGAWFFFLSKLSGAAVRFYVVCMLLQQFVFNQYEIPFFLTVPVMVLLIWLYTRHSGIKTLVWTDTLQTLCMFTALIVIIIAVIRQLGMTPMEALTAVSNSEYSRIFVFDDWASPQNFWKQFLSGIFIVIVMTGLDQDMMQKNLTCSSLRDAQKDVCSYGLAFLPANFLFLVLGILLTMLAAKNGIALPEKGDLLLPSFAATGNLGITAMVLFTIGIVASSFSSADSALTALTTSFCVDIMQKPENEQLRRKAHIGIAIVFILTVLAVNMIGTSSVINAIYIMCSYTYGPLLGLFLFGMFIRREVKDKYVPYICIASPLLCYMLDTATVTLYNYHFGYELLMVNALICMGAMYLCSTKKGAKG